ncbi:hypothetical protein KFK09_011070 [Dendrobium nobile]|uniref:Uncharacterized protein n=1 Tax=Dendrobium nobile TaxID=94219 RepID=A0A8T3BHB2_DENNO|nr:hypothetical protein KFK09_011070 [Dendrobium nobile]
MKPPTLLSLTIDSALLHIAHIKDLSAVPDFILVELFLVIVYDSPSSSSLLHLLLVIARITHLSLGLAPFPLLCMKPGFNGPALLSLESEYM